MWVFCLFYSVRLFLHSKKGGQVNELIYIAQTKKTN